jgi:hypothetical protein
MRGKIALLADTWLKWGRERGYTCWTNEHKQHLANRVHDVVRRGLARHKLVLL